MELAFTSIFPRLNNMIFWHYSMADGNGRTQLCCCGTLFVLAVSVLVPGVCVYERERGMDNLLLLTVEMVGAGTKQCALLVR